MTWGTLCLSSHALLVFPRVLSSHALHVYALLEFARGFGYVLVRIFLDLSFVGGFGLTLNHHSTQLLFSFVP